MSVWEVDNNNISVQYQGTIVGWIRAGGGTVAVEDAMR